MGIKERYEQFNGSQEQESNTSGLSERFQKFNSFSENEFPDASVSPVTQEHTPLSFKQNVMLGLMPSDDLRVQYLKKELETGDVSFNPKVGLLADGKAINPKGFDVGDIPRLFGPAFQFASEIGGAIAGFGPGSVPGAIAGAAGGSAASEAIRFGIAKMEGLSPTAEQVFSEITNESITAAAGEGIGFGIGKLITKFGKKNTLSALSELAKKSVDGLDPKFAGQIMHFVGSMDKEAAERYVSNLKSGKNIINPGTLDPLAAVKLSQKTLFGKEMSFIDDVLPSGEVSNSVSQMLSDAAKLNDTNFDEFLSFVSNGQINKDVISSVKKFGVPAIQNAPSAGQLAVKTIDSYRELLSKAGTSLGEAELKAIKSKGTENFGEIVEFEKALKKIVNDLGITKSVKLKGFAPIKISVKGEKQFKELISLFRATPTKAGAKKLSESGVKVSFNEAGDPISKHFLSEMQHPIKIKDAAKINKKLDLIVDEILTDTKIPTEIRKSTADVANAFRSKIDERLGLKELNTSYSELKAISDEVRLNRAGVLDRFESLIKGFNNVSEAKESSFLNVLRQIPEGLSVLNGIERLGAKKQLSQISAKHMVESLEKQFKSSTILRKSSSNFKENVFEQFSNRFSLSKKTESRKFIERARDIAAAQEFSNVGAQNLFRIGALRNMLGVSALAFGFLGPAAGATSAAVSLGITNPKFLSFVARRFIRSPQLLRKVASKTKPFSSGPVSSFVTGKIPAILLTKQKEEQNN